MDLLEAKEILNYNGYSLIDEGRNLKLNAAAQNKDDEYYTYMKDVEKEMKHYNFSGKVIYCCCDNPEWSNVYKYFEQNFDKLGLKRINFFSF